MFKTEIDIFESSQDISPMIESCSTNENSRSINENSGNVNENRFILIDQEFSLNTDCSHYLDTDNYLIRWSNVNSSFSNNFENMERELIMHMTAVGDTVLQKIDDPLYSLVTVYIVRKHEKTINYRLITSDTYIDDVIDIENQTYSDSEADQSISNKYKQSATDQVSRNKTFRAVSRAEYLEKMKIYKRVMSNHNSNRQHRVSITKHENVIPLNVFKTFHYYKILAPHKNKGIYIPFDTFNSFLRQNDKKPISFLYLSYTITQKLISSSNIYQTRLEEQKNEFLDRIFILKMQNKTLDFQVTCLERKATYINKKFRKLRELMCYNYIVTFIIFTSLFIVFRR